MKPRIVYLLPSLGLGGSERHVLSLACGLAARGYSVRIVTLFKDGPLAQEARNKGIPVVCLKLSWRWRPSTSWAIFRWLCKNPTDILHTYLSGFHFFAGLPARLAGVPTIVSSRRELAVWKKGRHHVLENLGNLFTDRIVCCSKAVEDHVRKTERIPKGGLCTIYNGYDGISPNREKDMGEMHHAVRARFGIPPGARVIGTVANFGGEKGYPYLLDSTEKIWARYPDTRFLLVGSGPLRVQMEDRAKHLSRPAQILFTGSVQDVRPFLAAMDIFIVASTAEGLPNSLLEAMAAGKPVVATCVGGIPEVIREGQDGVLVVPADSGMLAESVLALLSDGQRARQLGESAHERIAKSFRYDAMLDQYQKLHEELRNC